MFIVNFRVCTEVTDNFLKLFPAHKRNGHVFVVKLDWSINFESRGMVHIKSSTHRIAGGMKVISQKFSHDF